MASTSSLTRKGLIKREDTPDPVMLAVIRAVGSAVISTTGVLPKFPSMCLANSKPFNPGILTSDTTTSKDSHSSL